MSIFLVRLKRTPACTESMLMEHQKHLQRLRERQRLLATGPFADGTGGAYVIQAVTMEEAEQTVGEDLACRAKGMEAEIREWNVAYADFQTSK